MKPKLSEWASIAEIVSGIAVVVTLLFLILGIKENTEVSRASSYGRTMDGMIRFRQTVISDPETAKIWNSYQAETTTELDAVETTRMRQLVFMSFNIYEDAFYAREYGVLGESEWSRFRQQICRNWPLVVSAGIDEAFPTVLTPDFFSYISDLRETGC